MQKEVLIQATTYEKYLELTSLMMTANQLNLNPLCPQNQLLSSMFCINWLKSQCDSILGWFPTHILYHKIVLLILLLYFFLGILALSTVFEVNFVCLLATCFIQHWTHFDEALKNCWLDSSLWLISPLESTNIHHTAQKLATFC